MMVAFAAHLSTRRLPFVRSVESKRRRVMRTLCNRACTFSPGIKVTTDCASATREFHSSAALVERLHGGLKLTSLKAGGFFKASRGMAHYAVRMGSDLGGAQVGAARLRAMRPARALQRGEARG
jgi:hypothetical protein